MENQQRDSPQSLPHKTAKQPEVGKDQFGRGGCAELGPHERWRGKEQHEKIAQLCAKAREPDQERKVFPAVPVGRPQEQALELLLEAPPGRLGQLVEEALGDWRPKEFPDLSQGVRKH
jgi:hypothetical protein